MGLTFSTEKPTEQEKIENIKKIFDHEDTDDIIESLNITEFKPASVKQQDVNTNKQITNSEKKSIPLTGGFSNSHNQNQNEKKRYTKYDLFQMLKELDSDYQKGGLDSKSNADTDVDAESSLNDEKSIEHIKNVILKELENLKKNKSEMLGGNLKNSKCGCDGVKSDSEEQVGGNIIDDSSSSSSSDSTSSSDTEAGKNKSKKSRSNKKKHMRIEKSESVSDDSSKFFIETSESDDRFNITSNGEESEYGKKYNKSKGKKSSSKSKPKQKKMKKTQDDSDSDSDDDNKPNNIDSADSEGLSIFPFNSSDVKSSSVSVKNYRMLKRKI